RRPVRLWRLPPAGQKGQVMDHVVSMGLAILGILGFLLWSFRPQAPLLFRLLVSVIAIIWLVIYVIVELLRAEPTLWSGRAEMSIWTVVIIAIGVYALLNNPKAKEPR